MDILFNGRPLSTGNKSQNGLCVRNLLKMLLPAKGLQFLQK